MKNKKFVILGAQASGKGTQAEILSKRLKIPIFGMGEMLHAEGERETPRGRKIRAIIRRGGFVPFAITNELIKKRVAGPKARRGFIIDGYPRHIVQARFLNRLVSDIRVIYIKIFDKEAKRRISGRRVCGKCGEIYNLTVKPPKRKGLCDSCGGRLVTREDDKPKAIRTRLGLFHRETEPVIKYFARLGKLVEIDGKQSIEGVAKEIEKKLSKQEMTTDIRENQYNPNAARIAE